MVSNKKINNIMDLKSYIDVTELRNPSGSGGGGIGSGYSISGLLSGNSSQGDPLVSGLLTPAALLGPFSPINKYGKLSKNNNKYICCNILVFLYFL